MFETPEAIHARAAHARRMPPVEEWEEFPFDGDMRPRALLPPAAREAPREGEGRLLDLRATRRPIYLDQRPLAAAAAEPTLLPVVVLLHPRLHYAEPGDLPDELAAESGVLVSQ